MIMILGDSITAGFDVHKYFPEFEVANKGISGDNTEMLLARLKRDVITPAPEFLYILIGTNDLASLFSNGRTLENYERILIQLRKEIPSTKITVQSILPTRGLANRPNKRIHQLNTQIEKSAKNFGADFLDLTPLFTDPDGTMPEELSDDGLHLTEAGYAVWAAHLRKVFSECVLPR